MKRVLFLALTLQFGMLKGQTDAKIIKGNDTLKVKIELPLMPHQQPNYQLLQYGVSYFTDDGKKEKIGPSDIDILAFQHLNVEEVMVSHQNIFKDDYGNWLTKTKDILLHQSVYGSIQLYEFYYTEKSIGNTTITQGVPIKTNQFNQYNNFPKRKYMAVIRKGDGEISELPELGSFRKNIKEYISDCPYLIEKIDSKELGRDDLIEIINYYNKNCSTK